MKAGHEGMIVPMLCLHATLMSSIRRRCHHAAVGAGAAGLAALMLAAAGAAPAAAASRIKDIADFEGIRENFLVGYGLVFGLAGTGDDVNDDPIYRQMLVGMAERLGISVSGTLLTNLDSDNAAAVMVTANLPPFSRQGARIDVTISAMGTADDLSGGTLVVTPLLGADGEVYAVAQGQIAVGGFQAQGQGQTAQQGVTTSGRIANGGIIEREIGFQLNDLRQLKIALRNPDLTTSRRVAEAVNAFLGLPAARATDPGTVTLEVPPQYGDDTTALLTDIEQLRVEPDQLARVVIDEQTGTIVMGESVRLSTVAIAQGNLTIRITETPQVSQASPFAPDGGVALDGAGNPVLDADGNPIRIGGNTEVVNRTDIAIDTGEGRKLTVVDEGVSLQDLVNGLNALGIGPRDMITILQAVKTAGALQAELVVQ